MKRNNVPNCIGGEGMKERIHLYEPFFIIIILMKF